MKKVMISGKFDPPHEGHIDHLRKAHRLGNWLIVVVQSDRGVIATKGHCNIKFWARRALMEGLLLLYSIRGEVVEGVDLDGKSLKSLKHFEPDIFAKGGDRTPDNMPEDEVELCKELGIGIIYGVGDLLNASSRMEVKRE